MSSNLSCGIVGLPNVGKSTLFNALTLSQAAEASNYPFCTIEPNVGVVPVKDERLHALAKLSKSERTLFATMRFVDIAGLVAGASQGEGLGNKFLSNIREVDAICHVVRCFENSEITHVDGRVNPRQDIEIIELELILSDLSMVENALQKLGKKGRLDKSLQPAMDLLARVKETLDRQKPVRSMQFTPEEREILRTYSFLTDKPQIFVANVGEEDLPALTNSYVQEVEVVAKERGAIVVPISAKIEAEIAQMEEEEQAVFLQEMGLEESGLQRLVKASFSLLHLITFLTTGEKETRAWTIRRGTLAAEAAGKIHTDIQRGFIRAEVAPFSDYAQYGGRTGVKEAGLLRSEGKEYEMQDGDVVVFLHN